MKLRALFIGLAALLWASLPSQAQSTKTALIQQLNACIYANTQNAVTPQCVNAFMQSLIASMCGTAQASDCVLPTYFSFTAPPSYVFSPLELYVATGGSDSNDCLTATVTGGHGPCLTIGHTLSVAQSYDAGNHAVTINIGAGSWAESVAVTGPLRGSTGPVGVGQFYPQPNGSGAAEVLFSGAGSGLTTWNGGPTGTCVTAEATDGGQMGFRAMELLGTGTGCSSTLFAQEKGTIRVHDDVNFGAATVAQIHLETGSTAQIWQNYTISGGGADFVALGENTHIIVNSGVGTLTGTPNFSVAFIQAAQSATVQWDIANPWTGAATGKQFLITSNAVIEAYGNAGSIPGNALGWATSGARVHLYPGEYVSQYTAPSAGFGATAALALNANATPKSGKGVLTVGGAGISSAGTFSISLPYRVAMADGSLGVCQVSTTTAGSQNLANGGRVDHQLSTGTAMADQLDVSFNNNGNAFNAGTYAFEWICDGD